MILTVTLNPTVDKVYDVDRLISGDVVRVKQWRETAGGKGIQVAKVANLLREFVKAIGFTGGRNGLYIKNFLDGVGVATEFVDVSGETRTCVNIRDNSNGRITEILEPGAQVSEHNKEEFLEKYRDNLKSCDIVTICGSVPPGIEMDFYPKLIDIAKQMGKKVVLDTNGDLLRAGIEAKPDIIKPNRKELIEVLERPVETRDEVVAAALELKSKGIGTVIVSLGKDGAIFATDEGVFQGITPDIKTVNTVGCGDALVAVGFCRNLNTVDKIKLAMAVSTANALRKETGYFLQKDLQDLLKVVDAVKLE